MPCGRGRWMPRKDFERLRRQCALPFAVGAFQGAPFFASPKSGARAGQSISPQRRRICNFYNSTPQNPLHSSLQRAIMFHVVEPWGVSTVGRTSLPYFIPKTVKVGQAVNGESAQNSPKKFGALAQLVARNVRIVEVRGSNPLRSTTVRLKTNVFRRFFYVNDQNRARSDPKSRKKEGAPP